MAEFMGQASTIRECLHAYGIHSVTLQPELRRRVSLGTPSPSPSASVPVSVDTTSVESIGEEDMNTKRMRQRNTQQEIDLKMARCGMVCGSGSGKEDSEELTSCKEDMI